MAAQFTAFLEDDLWREIAEHANTVASQLRKCAEKYPEITFPYETEASAVFASMPREWLKPLRATRFFYVWDPETMLVRWSMGFDSTTEDVESLNRRLAGLSRGV